MNSNVALILSPYAEKFEPLDEANEIADSLQNVGFSVMEQYNDDVTVEDFKHLDQYGVVAISSHGQQLNGEFFLSAGQVLSAADQAKYEADLKTGRIAIGSDNEALITPEFIAKYTTQLPNSLVYVSSCHSTANNSLANAFLDNGAGAFVGYSDKVKSDFANPHGQEMFDALIKGQVTGQIPGINSDAETDETPAKFELKGSDSLSLFSGLNNGTFETGNFSGWVTQGDTRLITALGPLAPPEGDLMAIISTGLGSVEDSQSSISQTLFVSPYTKKLSLTYDFISEEPMEFVDSEFDDKFEVVLKTQDGEETVIAEESVNQSAWEAIDGIDFYEGDDTTFHTGFQTVDYDLTPFQGEIVTLQIRTFDKGDSLFDTAAVVDDVQVEIDAPENTQGSELFTPVVDNTTADVDSEITQFNGKYYEWVAYTIQPGDTLSQIAMETMGDKSPAYYNFIAEYNEIGNPDLIFAGETIYVPQETSAASAGLGQDESTKLVEYYSFDLEDEPGEVSLDLTNPNPEVVVKLLQADGKAVETINLSELLGDSSSVDDLSNFEQFSNVSLSSDGLSLTVELNPNSEDDMAVESILVQSSEDNTPVSVEKGKPLTDEIKGIYEDIYNELVEEYGESYASDVLHQWNKNFGEASPSLNANEKLTFLYSTIAQWVGRYDQAKGLMGAIDAAINYNPTSDSPAEGLAAFKAFFDGARGLVPYVPVFYEFLAGYSQVLGKMVDVAEEWTEQYISASKAWGSVDYFSSLFPGGTALYEYMVSIKSIKTAENMPDIPEGVIDWVKEAHHELYFITGEKPPAEKKVFELKIPKTNWKFGEIDFLKSDEVDDEELKNWFHKHRVTIVHWIYGKTTNALL